MEWNQMIPEFDVFNLEESIHFYVDLIGFHIVYDRKEDKFALACRTLGVKRAISV